MKLSERGTIILTDHLLKNGEPQHSKVNDEVATLEAKLEGRPSAEQFSIVLEDREKAEAKLEAMEKIADLAYGASKKMAGELLECEAKLERMEQVYDAAFRLAIRPGLSGGLKIFGKNLRISLAKVNLAQIRPWLSKSEIAAAQKE